MKTRLGLGVPTIEAAKDAIDFYPAHDYGKWSTLPLQRGA